MEVRGLSEQIVRVILNSIGISFSAGLPESPHRHPCVNQLRCVSTMERGPTVPVGARFRLGHNRVHFLMASLCLMSFAKQSPVTGLEMMGTKAFIQFPELDREISRF